LRRRSLRESRRLGGGGRHREPLLAHRPGGARRGARLQDLGGGLVHEGPAARADVARTPALVALQRPRDARRLGLLPLLSLGRVAWAQAALRPAEPPPARRRHPPDSSRAPPSRLSAAELPTARAPSALPRGRAGAGPALS